MLIAQQVTAQPMSVICQELLFGPLDLTNTWLPGDQPERPLAEPATMWSGDRPLLDRPLAMRSNRRSLRHDR